MMGLNGAIHTYGRKVMPLFNSSTANYSNFLSVISHWWVQDSTTTFFYYILNRICWMLFVLLLVFSHTFMSIKYTQLSIGFVCLVILFMVSCYTLDAHFQHKSLSFFSFQLCNLLFKVYSQGFSRLRHLS